MLRLGSDASRILVSMTVDCKFCEKTVQLLTYYFSDVLLTVDIFGKPGRLKSTSNWSLTYFKRFAMVNLD